MSELKKSVFKVPKMDCPSEENLIRMALASQKDVSLLQFDLNNRVLTAFHQSDPQEVLKKLEPLNFGAAHVRTDELSEIEENLFELEKAKARGDELGEAKVLKILLAINTSMFVFEIILGFIAQSSGLIADSMDMFADAAVYGVSLYAVGKAVALQYKAARISGYTQIALAAFALLEVVRRYFGGSDPDSSSMVWVSLIALIANVTCLMLITRHRNDGVHMKASLIFSANDVIANLGVILAGCLVYFFESSVPDLVIGLIIAVVVLRGGFAILKISKPSEAT